MNDWPAFLAQIAPLDYVFLGIILLSATVGMWRGIVSEVLSVLSWLLALLAAWFYAAEVAPLFAHSIEVPLWRLVLAFVLIFMVVILLVSLLRYGLRELLHSLGLRSIDRFFGFVFGSVRGVAVALLLVVVAGLTGLGEEPWWQVSVMVPYLESVVVAAKPWMPAVIADHLHLPSALHLPPLGGHIEHGGSLRSSVLLGPATPGAD